MSKLLTRKGIERCVLLICALLPFIWVFGVFIANCFADGRNYTDIGDLAYYFSSSSDDMFIYELGLRYVDPFTYIGFLGYNGDFADFLVLPVTLLRSLGFYTFLPSQYGSLSGFAFFVCGSLVWYWWVLLFDIVYHVFSWIPHLIMRLFDWSNGKDRL